MKAHGPAMSPEQRRILLGEALQRLSQVYDGYHLHSSRCNGCGRDTYDNWEEAKQRDEIGGAITRVKKALGASSVRCRMGGRNGETLHIRLARGASIARVDHDPEHNWTQGVFPPDWVEAVVLRTDATGVSLFVIEPAHHATDPSIRTAGADLFVSGGFRVVRRVDGDPVARREWYEYGLREGRPLNPSEAVRRVEGQSEVVSASVGRVAPGQGHGSGHLIVLLQGGGGLTKPDAADPLQMRRFNHRWKEAAVWVSYDHTVCVFVIVPDPSQRESIAVPDTRLCVRGGFRIVNKIEDLREAEEFWSRYSAELQECKDSKRR